MLCDIPAGDVPAAVSWLRGGGEMGTLIRAMDWAQTPLGPIDTWPQSLRTTVSLCVASNFPISIAWGPHRVQIYNDGYWPICGGKHPHSMGQDFKACWFSAWPAIGEAFERASAGDTSFIENQRMFLDRHGYLEETFFTFSFSPIRDETGGVGGLFHPVTELTQQTLAERRLKVVRDLADCTADAQSVAQACTLIEQTLAACDLDVPFFLLYLLDADGTQARLAASAGLAPGTAASPETVDLVSPPPPAWPLAEAARSGQSAWVEEVAKQFGPLACGPYPESPQTALVLPISLVGLAQPFGLLVAGVSARRALDEAYRTFYEMLKDTVTNALANARAYEEERKRAEALAELDRAKTAFFSNVSHEFRTPLTLMLGPVEDLLDKPADQVLPENRDLLTVVHRNGLRLQKLVNTLLDFSRIEAGRVQAVYESTDLATLTAELASNFRSACERAGLRLVVDCPALPEPVYVDRDMWEKIVLNLLSNAFKFTFTGEIAVTLRSAGKAVDLAVRDTGIGIPAVELPRLFERFHRVEGAHGRTHEGTGIGLALVQELVKLHGGSVRVESATNRGSTFIVSIPTGTAHLPADRIGGARTMASTALGADPYVEEALRWLPEVSAPALTPVWNNGVDGLGVSPSSAIPALSRSARAPGRRARILWADDNADMRDYVRRLLRVHYDVEAVADGEAALAAARLCRPDLVLADVMMPRLDGFGVLRALRANPETRTLPVILLSARAGEEARIEGLEAGADAYLVKPFSARELLAHVEAHLELGRLRARIDQERAALADLFQQTPVPIAVLRGPELVYELANAAYLKVFGDRDIVGEPLRQALPDFQGQRFDQVVRNVMQTGMAHVGHEALLKPDRQGTGTLEDTYWTFICAPLQSDHGQVERVIAICNDVTEPMRAQRELERLAAEATAALHERQQIEAALREQTEVVETINRVGQTLSAELDLPTLVQAVTDAATALTGAQFGAFFYNVSDARGESYMLYSLAGASHEQFARFPLPRNTALFEPIFRGMGVDRLADVTQDPRYGQRAPYYGLPPGHLPVTSYLAVPVVSRSGEVLGGLFLGHAEAGVFNDRHEQIVIGLAAQAAVAIDNARLFTAAQHEISERQQLTEVLRDSEQRYRHLVHALPAAVYTCDAQGRITLYNEAAVALWGRAPKVGTDLWCGSWRIYAPDGTPLPLDQCPMAVAIREGRSIRDQEIVIERSDGTRRHVLPYPDPVRNASGEIVGAINMLVDLTESKRAEGALRESEQRYRHLFDTAGVSLWEEDFSAVKAFIEQLQAQGVTDFQRFFDDHPEMVEQAIGMVRVIDINAETVRLLGARDKRDLLGSLHRIFVPETRQVFIDQLLTIAAERTFYETETVLQTLQGKRLHVLFTVTFPPPNASHSSVLVSLTDISARKQAEVVLQQAHADLEQRVQERTALLMHMQDITRAANEATESAEALQYAVDRLCAYTGWPVGHAYLSVSPGADRWTSTDIWHLDTPECFTAFQQATQALEVVAGEGLIGRVVACGQTAWLVDVASDSSFRRRHAAMAAGLKAGIAVPILVGSAVVGVLEFYTTEPLAPQPDLLEALTQMGTQLGRAVERERTSDQAKRQQEALLQREKLAAMSTLLASVAHELNNPLASIVLQAELLREDVRQGPLVESVTEISQAAARCERLVRQFLTLARQHPPERMAVALNTLVAETVELLAYPLRVDNVAVHLQLDEQLPPFWGDPHQLQQVIINLLTNAQHALRAAPGQRQITLTTHYDAAQHRMTLAVADTGPGIPPALQGRIFEPFFTTKPPAVGTGLGLPLCRGIIESHGGTLEVASAPGHGATFQIALTVESTPASMPAPPSADAEDAKCNHTILVVEDEPSLARGLARLLRRDGHTVDTAANGRLALAQLETRAYDLILCDVRMPELDGPSLYRHLERRQPHLCPRFIFLTGDTLEPTTQEFLEQSGVPCLTKPYSIAEARHAIRRALDPEHTVDTLSDR